MAPRPLAGPLLWLASLALTSPAFGQFTPQGAEFPLHPTPAGWQSAPAAAFDASGNFVTAWETSLAGSTDTAIFARRWNADGTAATGEFQVSVAGVGCRAAPAVAMAPDGTFAVVWQSQGQDGDGWGVYARRYDKTAAPVGAEILVNPTTAGDQQAPAAAYDPSGGFFTVAWESQGPATDGWDVYARQIGAASGAPLAGELRLSAATPGDQRHPALAAGPGGRLTFAWEGPDADGTGIVLRAFSSTLVAPTGEVAANAAAAGFQSFPALGCDDSGNCTVAWEGDDGDGSGVFARRFDRNLAPLAAEFLVNATTAGVQGAPSVAVFPAGDAVIAWESLGQDAAGPGIFARRYDFALQPQGAEFNVDSFGAGTQRNPRLAASPLGFLLAVWESLDEDGADGDAGGVYGQRYDLAGLKLYTIMPCRLFDSRNSVILTSGFARTIPGTGLCGIPATARALSVNLSVTVPSGGGYIVTYPSDSTFPNVSQVNFSAGQTRSNNSILTLARTGAGTFTVAAAMAANGTVHVIVDVNGYFQ